MHHHRGYLLITYVTGDLFESPAQTIVNTVNTIGVMGKGLALRFKRTFPDMFEEYSDRCERGELDIGTLFLWRTSNKVVLNFPTKTTWRKPSQVDYIRRGLETFRANYSNIGIHSIAFPPLGCGNGELDFEKTVRPIMEEHLSDLPIPVFIYAPHPRKAVAEHRAPEDTERWLRSMPRDLPFEEVREDLARKFATRTTVPSLTGRAEFDIEYRPSKEGDDEVRVWTPGRTFSLPMNAFMSIWDELRTRPLVTAATSPTDREKDVRFVMATLAVLPYVRVLSVESSYDAFQRNPSYALHLVPPAESDGEQFKIKLS